MADAYIVAMQPGDLPEVLIIEAQAHPVPWTENIFVEELQRDWGRLAVLKTDDGLVQGYCNFWLVHDEVHLLNIAVHEDRRQMGYGRALLEHVLEFAVENQCRYVTLEVRKSNQAAISLYGSHRFKSVGLRPAYYADNKEDAVVMLLDFHDQAAESDHGES